MTADFEFGFSVIQDTYREDSVDSFYDVDLKQALLQFVKAYYEHADIRVVTQWNTKCMYQEITLEDYVSHYPQDDGELLATLYVRDGSRVELCMEVQSWIMVGGPYPYHDSYTYSFHSRKDIANDIFTYLRNLNKWKIGDNIHQAPTQTPIKVTGLWDRILWVFGIQRPNPNLGPRQ
ncbi:MAG: hypothetical protein SFY80_12965 [Verrucomicrobiota bacterium]|nr:hypothetical protein [Verrucomicrobiota bacterium]